MLGWELPPYNSGGLGVACFQMAKALAARGDIDMKFILPYKAKHKEADKFLEIIPASDLPPMMDETGNFLAMGAYAGICSICHTRDCEHAREFGEDLISATKKYAVQIARLLKKQRLHPDIIHCHDWLTMPAGIRAKQLTGRPLIVHVHATEFDRAGGHYGNPLIHEIEYQGLVMADRIFANSKLTKDTIVREYRIPADKIEVVYNSLDPSELSRTVVETDNYLYAKKLKSLGYTIVTNGGSRLTVQKGFAYLMEAMALAMSRNPKLLLLLGSDGEQRDQLIELAADLGISDHVIFTGFIRGARRDEIYEVADIFVMPSVSEPFGIAALEAAHYDNALLLSKTSGAGEVLNSIMKFDYWDTRKLADEIINISLSSALSAELREGVKREYLRISWDDVAEQMSREYEKLASRNMLLSRKLEASYA